MTPATALRRPPPRDWDRGRDGPFLSEPEEALEVDAALVLSNPATAWAVDRELTKVRADLGLPARHVRFFARATEQLRGYYRAVGLPWSTFVVPKRLEGWYDPDHDPDALWVRTAGGTYTPGLVLHEGCHAAYMNGPLRDDAPMDVEEARARAYERKGLRELNGFG